MIGHFVTQWTGDGPPHTLEPQIQTCWNQFCVTVGVKMKWVPGQVKGRMCSGAGRTSLGLWGRSTHSNSRLHEHTCVQKSSGSTCGCEFTLTYHIQPFFFKERKRKAISFLVAWSCQPSAAWKSEESRSWWGEAVRGCWGRVFFPRQTVESWTQGVLQNNTMSHCCRAPISSLLWWKLYLVFLNKWHHTIMSYNIPAFFKIQNLLFKSWLHINIKSTCKLILYSSSVFLLEFCVVGETHCCVCRLA